MIPNEEEKLQNLRILMRELQSWSINPNAAVLLAVALVVTNIHC